MVPDVKYNEAYISFVLIHPEWPRGGIGTYMIYHLIDHFTVILAFEWMWGWGWPCFDTNLFPFLMEIMLKKY